MTVAAGTALLAGAGAPALASAPGQAAHAGRGPERPGYGNPKGHVTVPPLGRPVSTTHPNHVIGNGTAASCTSAAIVRAVAKGGIIVFRCGPRPVTIMMRATAKVVNTSRRVVIDGGGKVTLSGGGKRRILYLNTCDPKQVFTTTHCFNQQWPKLIVQNLTFKGGNAQVRQTKTSNYGGGAIYTDGDNYSVVVGGTIMRDNSAREGGGAIFYVSDDNTGTLTIEHSTLHHNPSAGFWTRPYVGVFYKSSGHPKVIDSTLN